MYRSLKYEVTRTARIRFKSRFAQLPQPNQVKVHCYLLSFAPTTFASCCQSIGGDRSVIRLRPSDCLDPRDSRWLGDEGRRCIINEQSEKYSNHCSGTLAPSRHRDLVEADEITRKRPNFIYSLFFLHNRTHKNQTRAKLIMLNHQVMWLHID